LLLNDFAPDFRIYPENDPYFVYQCTGQICCQAADVGIENRKSQTILIRKMNRVTGRKTKSQNLVQHFITLWSKRRLRISRLKLTYCISVGISFNNINVNILHVSSPTQSKENYFYWEVSWFYREINERLQNIIKSVFVAVVINPRTYNAKQFINSGRATV